MRGPCPIHGGDSDAFAIYCREGELAWTCHSACGSGDAFALIAALHGLDTRRQFAEVLEVTAALVGFDSATVDVAKAQELAAARTRRLEQEQADRHRFDDEGATVFEALVRACPLGGEALNYIKLTRLCWTRTDQFRPAFELGLGFFWPDAWAGTVALVGAEVAERHLQHAERDFGARPLVMSVTDVSGRVVGVQGRSLDPACSKDRRFTGRGRLGAGFFGGRDLGPVDDRLVVLTEGCFDALSLRVGWRELQLAWGSHVVIGRAGAAGGLSREQAAQLAGRRVRLVFDGDEAGRRGRDAAVVRLREVGVRELSAVEMPRGTDVNSLGSAA